MNLRVALYFKGESGMNQKVWLAVVVATLWLSACRTTDMDNQRVMAPPETAQASSIQTAIKQTVLKNTQRGWMVEVSNAQEVVVGLHKRSHYLQVTYSLAGNKLESKITDSKNLNQEGNQIHKSALRWKDQLDQQVFIAVSQL